MRPLNATQRPQWSRPSGRPEVGNIRDSRGIVAGIGQSAVGRTATRGEKRMAEFEMPVPLKDRLRSYPPLPDLIRSVPAFGRRCHDYPLGRVWGCAFRGEHHTYFSILFMKSFSYKNFTSYHVVLFNASAIF